MTRTLATCLLVLTVPLLTPHQGPAEPIRIDSITDLGAGVVPTAINNNGVVAGYNSNTGHAFVWNGTYTELPTLGGAQSYANDINDSGVVVGWANKSNGKKAAFKWDAVNGMVNLDPASSIDNVAESINKIGDIVGWRQGTSTNRSVLWTFYGGRSTLFGTTDTRAYGINDKGEVVGVYMNSVTQIGSGYYWDGTGTEITAGFLSYHPTAGINNNSLSGGENSAWAYYWQKHGISGVVPRIDSLDTASLVCGLNDNDCLVGYTGYNKAFMFDTVSYTLYDMTSVIPTSSTFTEFNTVNDINNSSLFVGVGTIAGVDHGFIGQISDVPEPSTIVLLCSGLAAMVLVRRRRAGSPASKPGIVGRSAAGCPVGMAKE